MLQKLQKYKRACLSVDLGISNLLVWFVIGREVLLIKQVLSRLRLIFNS